jgi:hypothetical protein
MLYTEETTYNAIFSQKVGNFPNELNVAIA